jgi:hypothetical protein
MGLDASVLCTCYREGRTTLPPFNPELLVFDEDGWPTLDLPYHRNEELYGRFDSWLCTCCQHEDMEAARVRISNWGGYRAFQAALAQAGWEQFPTLHQELPDANGGATGPTAAVLALEELAAFRQLANLGHNWFLVDTDTGEAVAEYIAAYDGKLVLSGREGLDIGLDPHGLFVVSHTQPSRELFRATRLEQRLEPTRERAGGSIGPVEFVNLDTGQRFACTTEVAGREISWPDGRMQDDDGRLRFRYPRHLQVERRAIAPAEFEHAVSALEEVFRAAVATGNPVRWT